MLNQQIKPGLRVLVTAGGSGIGRVIAECLAASHARVHICDIDEQLVTECQGNIPSLSVSRADVSSEAEVQRMFEDVRAALGGLDVLVNNAGIAGPTGGVEEITPADWQRTIDVNLNGAFYCTHLAVPLLRRAENGLIINISSVAGRLGFADRTPYAATKWALVGLTQSLAKELGPSGIRVNAILPGIVEGPRITRVIQARAEHLHVSYAEAEKEAIAKVSLRRMVSAQDVAAMVLFLCSEAARNISGQSLSVCGNVESL